MIFKSEKSMGLVMCHSHSKPPLHGFSSNIYGRSSPPRVPLRLIDIYTFQFIFDSIATYILIYTPRLFIIASNLVFLMVKLVKRFPIFLWVMKNRLSHDPCRWVPCRIWRLNRFKMDGICLLVNVLGMCHVVWLDYGLCDYGLWIMDYGLELVDVCCK